ncbi:MAG TPA: hypothetical protein VIH31_01965 [Candidatus Paceibacterota bacterium]
MDFKQPYTDTTLLLSGPYKFTALCRVPPEYLLSILKKKKFKDKALKAYIINNIELIKARSEGRAPIPQLTEVRCEKVTFLSPGEAKKELRRITKFKQKRRKPIREYQCDKCHGWHLTSIPIEEWGKAHNRD